MSPYSPKVHSQCMCTGGFKFSHHARVTCILDHYWRPDSLTCHNACAVHPKLKCAQRKFECENKLLVSNSAGTSFCLVKVKHQSEEQLAKHLFKRLLTNILRSSGFFFLKQADASVMEGGVCVHKSISLTISVIGFYNKIKFQDSLVIFCMKKITAKLSKLNK